MVGSTISHYEVLEKLGEGGMGMVYKAKDLQLGRFVAIKALIPSPGESQDRRARFIQEARAASSLNHPNIITIYEIVNTGESDCIVMEFVRGTALGSRISELGKLDPAEVRAIIAMLARTLDHAHASGIVHRDLKPENILLDHETGRPRLTDFGVALSRSADPLPSEVARAFGTPHFMSPEQAAGETDLDGRSDIYSLGVLGYLMVTGKMPFDASHFAAIAAKHIGEAHKPIIELAPKAPLDLIEALERYLEKAPERRWKRAGRLADALTGPANRLKLGSTVGRFGRFAALVSLAFGLSGRCVEIGGRGM